MTFTQDNRNNSTITQDSRTAVASLSQDSKTTTGTVWLATIYPWISTYYPWVLKGNGQQLNLDSRNV